MVEMSTVNSPQTSPQPSPKGEGVRKGEIIVCEYFESNTVYNSLKTK